jgi:hypothetical protein
LPIEENLFAANINMIDNIASYAWGCNILMYHWQWWYSFALNAYIFDLMTSNSTCTRYVHIDELYTYESSFDWPIDFSFGFNKNHTTSVPRSLLTSKNNKLWYRRQSMSTRRTNIEVTPIDSSVDSIFARSIIVIDIRIRRFDSASR